MELLGALDWHIAVAGLLIGILIGLTGMGGGALMTPILILFLNVKPVFAVGTDLVYAAITKVFGGFFHWRQNTVDMKLVGTMAIGSVPAALSGVLLIEYLKTIIGIEALNEMIKHWLGIALVLVALTLLLRPLISRKASQERRCVGVKTRPAIYTVLLGASVGLLVGLTSVGSGTLIAVALLLFYPYLSMSRVVGTDVFHGAILVGVAGLAHFGAGNVEIPLVVNLLIGSVPGVIIGSKLSVKVPESFLRPALVTILALSGWKLI